MSYNPNFAANWDSRLIPDPELEEATEANQLQSNIAPFNYGLDGYPGPGAYHHHAPNGAMNHTGNFGATGLHTLDDYDITGHLVQPTSTTSALPPSPASVPSMTEGSSRSPSNDPGTPGSANDEGLGWLVNFLATVQPQLTSAQLAYYHHCLDQGTPLQPQDLQDMVDFNNMARSSEPLQNASTAGPTAATQPAFANGASTNAISHSTHAHATQGPHRTQHAHERRRYAPYNPTTSQAAASGADLKNNNPKSTGATLTGSVQSSSTSGSASSLPRSANATAGPSTASSVPIPTPRSSPRYGHPLWDSPLMFIPEVHRVLNDMFLSQGESVETQTCHFPGCTKGKVAKKQTRDRHVHSVHLKTTGHLCKPCTEKNPGGKRKVIQRRDGFVRHMRDAHGIKVPSLRRGRGKGKGKEVIDDEEDEDEDEDEDEEDENGVPGEMVSMPQGPRKDDGDDDDAGFGGMGGMFAAGSYGTLQT